jgi:hypothetical protein
MNLNEKLKKLSYTRLILENFVVLLKILIILNLWFLAFALIDNIFSINILLRWLNFFGFAFFILYKFKKIYYNFKIINPQSTANLIDDLFNFKDQIISSYQLHSKNESSNPFIQELNKHAINLIKNVKIKNIINLKNFYHTFLKFSVTFSFLILYAIIYSQNFYISLNRFLNPFYKIKQYHKIVKFELYPKDVVILEGSDLKITLKTFGKVNSVRLVFLNVKSDNTIFEIPQITAVSNISETNKIYIYEFTMKNIYDEFKYYAETFQTRENIIIKSDKYSIKVVKAPYVKNLKLIYNYPYYTALKPKVVEENGNIEAVEKTLVKIIGTANNLLKSGEIIFKTGRKINLNINENKFEAGIFVISDDEYFIKLKDIYGNTNSNSVKYHIISIKDKPPTVEIVRPGVDIELKDNFIIPIEISAQDDYAVNNLWLYYKIHKKYIETEPKLENIEFKSALLPEVKINYNWDLNKLKISPGDYIEYYACAWDGYKPSDSHLAFSQKYFIKFPTITEMYQTLNKEQSENIISLQDLLKEQENLLKETEKSIKTLEEKKEMSYIEKKEMERLKEQQEKIASNIKNLSEKMDEIVKKIEKEKMFTPQLIEKTEQIKNLIDELYDRELKEAIKQLQEAAEKINLDESKRKLLSTKITQEEILKRLDKTIEMLKKLKVQQQVESFKKSAEEIIKKEQKLLQDTIDAKFKNNFSGNELSKRQNEINNDFQKFKNEFNKFVEDIKNNYPEISNPLKESLNQSVQDNIEKEMNNSANSLKNSNWDSAMNSQRKIISSLNNFTGACDKACSSMQNMDLSKVIDTIDSTIFNIVNISQKMEAIKNKIELLNNIDTKIIDNSESKFDFDNNLNSSHIAEKLIFIERAIREQVKILENGTKSVLIFNPSFFKQFDNIYNYISQSREFLSQDRLPSALTFERNALIYLNVILRELLELKEQIKEQAQAQASAGMSDALNQIADAQQKLNELTERLKGQIGQSGITPELQQYLEELAFQQELIRKSVNQFIENYKNAGELLGNLAKAGEEMNEIKEKLKSGKIDSELIERQNKVLKRLLDSQKSLYVKEYSKERKAESAKEYKVEKPPEIEPEKLKEENKKYYYQIIEKYPLDYQKLVEDYFKVLSAYEDIIYKK